MKEEEGEGEEEEEKITRPRMCQHGVFKLCLCRAVMSVMGDRIARPKPRERGMPSRPSSPELRQPVLHPPPRY